MMNTMIKKSPNQVCPIPRRNNEVENEEVDTVDSGIIYPPEYSVAQYSVAQPMQIYDPYSIPLAPAFLIEEQHIHNAEEGRLPNNNEEEPKSKNKMTKAGFDPFQPIHSQCNHISYGCLTMAFLVFVGCAVLVKMYLPDIIASSASSVHKGTIGEEENSINPSFSPSFVPTVKSSNQASLYPSPSPSFLPTIKSSNQPSLFLSLTPSNTKYYETKKLVASDGEALVRLGRSCSLSKDLVVIGAPGGTGKDNYKGAAYLFDVNGNLIKKLTPVGYGKADDTFGWVVSMDEKIVVGSNGKFVQVFSRDGEYERTITCDEATCFGNDVATRGNLIVVDGCQNSIWKLFIFTTEGKLLKTLDVGSNTIWDVEISEQFIVSTSEGGTTIVYSNEAPDFPKITEIEQGGTEIALSGDKLVIGKYTQNDNDGAAWLYSTDGTLMKELYRQDGTSGSSFGRSVAITDDKILVGADGDDDGSINAGSVFIYSAATGDCQEKVLAPDAQAYDVFGGCVSASESLYVVGASGVDDNGDRSGAAYLFPFSD